MTESNASDKNFDGCDDPGPIDFSDQSSEIDTSIMTTCRFISNRNYPITVTVRHSPNAVQNGTIYHQGEDWYVHVNPNTCYCWSPQGPAEPNCSLRCTPGGVYYVG